MERDVKVGLVLGVLLVAVIAVVFFRREPQAPAAAVVASAPSEPTPDELPVIRTRPEPYHVSPDYLRQLLAPRLAQRTDPEQPEPAAPPASTPESSDDGSDAELARDSSPPVPPPSQVPPPAPELDSPPKPGHRYVVRPGDTLASIAEAAYGSQRYYRALYEANRDVLVSPGELPVGLLIRIPPLAELEGARGTRNTRDTPLSRTEGNTYRVRPGDTLRSIARRLYGDERMYRRIFRANRDKLASPSDLRPGMVLRLP